MDDHRTRPWLTRLASVALALVLAACGADAGPSADVDESGGPGRSPSSSAADPSTAALLAALPTVPVRQADAIELEERLAREVIAASGLVADLGVERWAWAETALRDAIADAAAGVGVAYGPPKLAGVEVFAAGPVVADGATGLAMGLTLGVALTLDMSGPNPLSGDGLSADSTSERTDGGERTVARIVGRLSAPSGRGRIAADVEFSVDLTVFDAATGQQLRTSSFRTTGRIEIDECPDSDGKVRGSVRLSMDAAAAGDSVAYTVEADIVGTVDESATLTTVDAQGSTSDSATVAGRSQMTRARAGFRTGVGADGTLTPDRASTHGSAESTEDLGDEQVDQRYRRIAESIGLAAWLMGDKAQKRWRGGACVEIRATEQSRTVRPSALVQFEAEPFHKIEQRPLDKPIVATFTGERSAEPMDDALRPPVLYSFTAAPQKDRSGTIAMTSTSNRGIGTLAITFTTKLEGWTIDYTSAMGSQSGRKCGDAGGEWVLDGTYGVGGQEGIQHWVITIDAQTMTGTYIYTDDATMPTPVGVTTVKGNVRGVATLTILDSGVAQFHLRETFHQFTSELAGGAGSNAVDVPLQESDLDWQPGADCPTP